MTAISPIGVIAHYNLLERLDPAGPGELYRARDTRHGRTVAIRWLPPGFTSRGVSSDAIVEQARGLASLSHPNVITVFDAGEQDGRGYLVFEFLKGQSLRAEMAGRPVNVRRAVELAVQIADAVADAHAAGYVHGGLSPDSIVITAKGHAKIPVFEFASRGGFEPGEGGLRLRDYDSPEEARGGPADDRSDIYSVGAVLFEMLTTRRPSHRGAAAPSASNRHVPKELDEIILRAIAPNPESRYQSAATLSAELRAIGAILDVRGGAGDEPADDEKAGASVGGTLALTLVILAVAAAAVWWFL
ncbi:MAG: serine/threonine-protein kinase [Vicinamibacterales bacterium]